MITTDQAQQLLSGGGNVVDPQDRKIGSIGQLFLDDQTGQPEWVTTKTGMFGGAESFVPISDAEVTGQDVRVPFDKDKVKNAPRVSDSDGDLSQDEEAELYRHYGMEYTESSSAPTTDDEMTRSEEQVHVGKEQVSSGKARLRKFVVTENVTQTVPVSHEEVRVVSEPITEANRGDAVDGGDITSDEHEVTLTEERVKVEKETVPVERVRMDTETVTDDQQVSEEVRKEQIETDTSELSGNKG